MWLVIIVSNEPISSFLCRGIIGNLELPAGHAVRRLCDSVVVRVCRYAGIISYHMRIGRYGTRRYPATRVRYRACGFVVHGD